MSQPYRPPQPVTGIALVFYLFTLAKLTVQVFVASFSFLDVNSSSACLLFFAVIIVS
jgi:hypothetical protein